MNTFKKYCLPIAAVIILCTAGADATLTSPKMGVVNFKACVEKSKVGKDEQANFENLKKQMEEVMVSKEKELNDLSKKINDPDYQDSLSATAQAEQKHKFRSMNQELAQHQQQFYQVLQQANFKIVQKLNEAINEAAKVVAKNKGLDVIVNEEGTFFHNPAFDISDEIVKVMDSQYKAPAK